MKISTNLLINLKIYYLLFFCCCCCCQFPHDETFKPEHHDGYDLMSLMGTMSYYKNIFIIYIIFIFIFFCSQFPHDERFKPEHDDGFDLMSLTDLFYFILLVKI